MWRRLLMCGIALGLASSASCAVATDQARSSVTTSSTSSVAVSTSQSPSGVVESSSTVPMSETTVPETSTTTSTGATTTTTIAPEYTSMHPPGLSCDDFDSWESATGYWLTYGRPDEILLDARGIPCVDLMTFDPIVGQENEGWIYDHGLYCRDFAAQWEGPALAALYWLLEGQPTRMDADRDGIPCETVYPGVVMRDFLEGYRHSTYPPKGLYCRELVWYRWFYPEAVAYYYQEGLPARMDADNDGIPCETVYTHDGWLNEARQQDIAPGLDCEDLIQGDWPYYDVAIYWLHEGTPASLDPDGDGYPCSPGWGTTIDREGEDSFFRDGYSPCCAG